MSQPATSCVVGLLRRKLQLQERSSLKAEVERALGAELSGHLIPSSFRAGSRRTARPCAHCLGFHRSYSLLNPIHSTAFNMDPNSLIEALRGTMDPNLREAAERQLNEVKSRDGGPC